MEEKTFCINAGKEIINLDDETRTKNIAVYGAKGSGKTHGMLMILAKNQVDDEHRNEGATFVVSDTKIMSAIVAIATKFGRKIHVISPGYNANVRSLVDNPFSEEEMIKDSIIDYSKILDSSDIVVINTEPFKYGDNGREATEKLLSSIANQLYFAKGDKQHSLYVDNAELYCDVLERLLYAGNSELCMTLFFQSRDYLSVTNPHFVSRLEANCRTTIVLNDITHSDKLYFEKRFFGSNNEEGFKLPTEPNSLVIEGLKSIEQDVRIYTGVKYIGEVFYQELETEGFTLLNKTKKKTGRKKKIDGSPRKKDKIVTLEPELGPEYSGDEEY